MMEDTDEFKLAVKVVIKRQMRDLMEQLREKGEEIAILTVNLDDNSCSHFGSPNGEWFISEQKNITKNFLTFCQTNSDYRGMRPSNFQKKKSISTLKDSSSKQSLSSEIPEVKVTIPKNLAGELSEEEVASVVGRVVATHLAEQEKGDGSSSGTQFDLLVRTVHHSKQKGTSSMISTPSTRSARKRKPTAKFMEGMNSLKKSKKSEEEDSEVEVGHDETNVISLLKELNNAVLKRVKVSITDDQAVNLEKSTIEASETVESLAILVIQELDTLSGGQLANRKSIKLNVLLDEAIGLDVHIDIENGNLRSESIVEPSIDYSDNDLENEAHFEDGDSDMEDYLPDKYPEDPDGDACLKVVKKRKYTPRLKKKISSRKLSLPCNICGKLIVGKNNLDAHVRRVHFREKNYNCTICSKAFFNNSDIDAHMLSVHTRKCQSCGEYVMESVPWESGTHMQMKRVVACKCGSNVSITCSFGRKRANDDDRLRRKDTYKTQYACEHCGKLFTRKSHCLRHSKLHSGIKDIVCELCGESFRYKPSLRKHLASMHSIFEYPCKFCSERFTSTSDLEAHIMIHKEEGHVSDASDHVQDETSQNVLVLKKSPLLKSNRPTASVSTITNEEPDTYSIQLVHDVLHGLQQFAGDGSSIIIKSVDANENQ